MGLNSLLLVTVLNSHLIGPWVRKDRKTHIGNMVADHGKPKNLGIFKVSV